MRKPKKLVGFLMKPLDCTVIVVCPNIDGQHEGHLFFVRYVIFDRGVILDEPTREELEMVLAKFEKLPVKVLYGPCIWCQTIGITGPVGYDLPEHLKLPPDSFEGDAPYDDGYPKGEEE